jgi:imidazolonepropionase-like amidohydrolase
MIRGIREKGRALFSPVSTTLILALLLVPASTPAQDQGLASHDFIIRNVRVFDGERVISKADVVVRRGTIEWMGARSGNRKHLTEIDGTGKTLLPGLIDAHAHAYEEAHLRAAMAFGVTTELDMFSSPDFIRRMKRAQDAGGGLDRADVRSAGIWISAPGGYGTLLGFSIPTLARPADARQFVEERIQEGSDYIKVVYDDGAEYGIAIPSLNLETLVEVVKTSHERGRLVVAHVGSQRGAREAVNAGVDGLMHSFMDEKADPEFVSLLKQKRVFVVPTLSIESSILGESAGKGLANDLYSKPYLNPGARTNLGLAFPRSNARLKYENAQYLVRVLHEADVPLLAGTDAPNQGTWHGVSLHGELERLVACGLKPSEALASATSVPARAFRLSDRGEIGKGKRADLLLVEGDPTQNIKDLRRIAVVWKQGVALDRQAFQDAVEKENRQAQEAIEAERSSENVGRAAISDFEEGTPQTQFGSPWMAFSDAIIGGKSKASIHIVDGGAEHSAHALQVMGDIDSAFAYAWAGAAFFPGGNPLVPADISAHKRLVFWCKGGAKGFRVLLLTRDRGIFPASMDVAAGEEWQKRSLAWSEIGVDGREVLAIVFAGGPEPGSFSFEVDDISLE